MLDPRFFESLGPVSLAELAELTGAELVSASVASLQIVQVAPLVRADRGSISFLGDRRYLRDLAASSVGACFVAPGQADRAPEGCAVLLTAQPQAAYAAAAERLHRARGHAVQDPAIHPSAEIEDGAVLGHGVVVGPGAKIGRGSRLGANTVIGPGVAIGRDCRIGANVSIGFALIGDRVAVLSGATIGEQGFGVAAGPKGPIDVPQLGRVLVQDGVTIGANSCIDRGAWDDTVIGENTKIDNLVQVAHNVRLGRGCLLAAHTGISGTVTVGDGVAFGGRAGVADHVTIGAGAQIAAGAGVMKNVPAAEVWGGFPARPVRRWMRETAWLHRMAAPPATAKGDDIE